VRIASPTDRRLTWLAGIFYLHSDKREGGPIGFFFNPNTVAGLFSPDNNYVQNSTQSVATDSFALFGEADYALTSVLKFTFGARASVERKSGRSVVTYSIVDLSNIPPADVTYAHTWSAFTPKFTLTYQPNHNLMVYGTISEGFKSGGYDLSGASAASGSGLPDGSALVNAALARPFDQETVWNYEIGEKLTALDDRLTLDSALFDDEYHNLQTSQLVLINGIPVPITSNAGNARVWGLEVESQWSPAQWVDFGLTYAYMDAHFTSPGTGFQGARIPYAPKDQVHASVDFHYPLAGDAGKVDLYFDYTYHTRIFFDNANTAQPFLQSKSVWNGIVNGHLQYTSADTRWRLSVWGKNITAAEPVLHAADVTVVFQSLNEFLSGAPDFLGLVKYYPVRTWGVTVTRTF
jgi:iron complex outermembrane receptor protein